MQKIKLTIKQAATINSDIYISSGFLNEINTLFPIKDYSQLFIISDENVANYYLDTVINSYLSTSPQLKINSHIFKPGEKSKDITTFTEILRSMAKAGLDRKGIVLNLGGGVTTDMGGFAASTYQRGTKFFNISTTLEGMVDASIGGKTGINLDGYKNYIGLFNHPEAVFMDMKTLDTLPARELIAGFAEVIKHGIIQDSKYFDLATSKHPSAFTHRELEEIVKGSSEIKAKVVKSDEREVGQRRLLNFGHTIGHAVETASFATDHRYLHGEAVAIGMVAATRISELVGLLNSEETQRIEQAISSAGLPTRVNPSIDKQQILSLLKFDKKVEGNKINWTLINKIGAGVINQFVSSDIIEEAIATIKSNE